MVAVAIGGAAVLGAGASLAAGSQNAKAIDKSTTAQTQAQNQALQAQIAANDRALAAQTDAFNKSLGFQTSAYNSSGQLQTDTRNQNVAILQPWVSRGNDAGNQINSMLGLSTAQGYTPQPIKFTPIQTPAPTPAPATPTPTTNALMPIPAYANGTPWHPGGQALVGENGPELVNLPQGAQVIPNALGNWMRRHGNAANNNSQAPAAATPTPTANALSPQQQALNTFYQTPLYQFPLQQGLNAINASYAARGSLESGAAQKSLEKYASGVAGGALGDYFSLLGNQQGLGFSSASAQTGIGQGYANNISGLGSSYANTLSGLNSSYANNIGNLAGNLANAQGNYATNIGNINSNSAIAGANNTNSMIGGVGSALGGLAGYFAYQPYSGNGYASLAPAVSQNIAANPGIF